MLNRDDLILTRALERCEVPPEGFPHASHLHVAWVYLNESASLDEAVERMGSTLRRFAAAVGKAEKYSEPTTVFWMLQVAAARATGLNHSRSSRPVRSQSWRSSSAKSSPTSSASGATSGSASH